MVFSWIGIYGGVRRFSMAASSRQSYKEAVTALNTLQTNAADLERARKQQPNLWQSNFLHFITYMKRTGLEVDDLDRLSVIHVAGTKGKGSTCALVESVLRQCGLRTGLFTSPHLMEVRERFRIDGEILSYDDFAKYFWDTYNRLDKTKTVEDSSMPSYFRFLTLMSFHVFFAKKVDVAILEVGIGGLYDTTNIVARPVVCGISALGYDHTAVLGKTLPEIAFHKAGILKTGRPAFTSPQLEEGLKVLADVAKERQALLRLCRPLSAFPGPIPKLGLDGRHQLENASLAIQLCRTWLMETGRSELLGGSAVEQSEEGAQHDATGLPMSGVFSLPDSFRSGLEKVSWRGRCDTLRCDRVTFYLDGAHTVRSVKACRHWFMEAADRSKSRGKVARAIIFNVTGGREPVQLMEPLADLAFDVAVFCPNVATSGDTKPDITKMAVTSNTQLDVCSKNKSAWQDLLQREAGSKADLSSATCVVLTNVRDAVCYLGQYHDKRLCFAPKSAPPLPDSIHTADHVQVLVVGSLHLVGTVMTVFEECLNGKSHLR